MTTLLNALVVALWGMNLVSTIRDYDKSDTRKERYLTFQLGIAQAVIVFLYLIDTLTSALTYGKG